MYLTREDKQMIRVHVRQAKYPKNQMMIEAQLYAVPVDLIKKVCEDAEQEQERPKTKSIIDVTKEELASAAARVIKGGERPYKVAGELNIGYKSFVQYLKRKYGYVPKDYKSQNAFSEDACEEIRAAHENGESIAELAQRYGACISTIKNVLYKRRAYAE